MADADFADGPARREVVAQEWHDARSDEDEAGGGGDAIPAIEAEEVAGFQEDGSELVVAALKEFDVVAEVAGFAGAKGSDEEGVGPGCGGEVGCCWRSATGRPSSTRSQVTFPGPGWRRTKADTGVVADFGGGAVAVAFDLEAGQGAVGGVAAPGQDSEERVHGVDHVFEAKGESDRQQRPEFLATISSGRGVIGSGRGGNGDLVEHLGDHGGGGGFAQAAFGTQDEAMREDERGDFLYVVGQDEVEALDGGEGLGGAQEGETGARAAAETNRIVLARGADDARHVIPDAGLHVNGPCTASCAASTSSTVATV